MSLARGAILVLALTPSIAGCGSGGQPSSSPTSEATAQTQAAEPAKAFDDYEKLVSGRTYTTRQLTPAIRLTVPRGTWNTESGDRPDGFAVAAAQSQNVAQAILAVHRIAKVFDPVRGGRRPGDAVPFKGDFAGWLRRHPHLETTRPGPVNLLGLKGVELDVTGRSSPPRIPEDCGAVGNGCVVLFHDGFDYAFYSPDLKGRFDVLDLPQGGQLVLERFADPAGAFKAALRKLQPVLDGMSLAN
jgi:hypothetical protein